MLISHKSIERKQFRGKNQNTALNEVNNGTIETLKCNENKHAPTYKNYLIATAILLTWYRTFKEKWRVGPGFMASKTSHLYCNVENTVEMTTLHDRKNKRRNTQADKYMFIN